MNGHTSRLLLGALAFGYAFLYVPILSMIVYSFNESRLVTVWAGFSLKWWGEFFRNEDMLEAAWLSFRIAVVNSFVASLLGACAGFALARYPRFAGRSIFSGLIAAPLVMPEVIMGIASLLLFVVLERLLGWPERGFATIAIAHITFSAAFVAVIIQSRLADFDRSMEEAAMDLGARPFTVFRTVTLPLIAPALVSGWLLAFTLSMDDVILAQFTAGPQSQTLPMLVYSSVRLGVSPQINVLATIIVTVVGSAIVLAGWLMHRGRRRHERDAQAAAQVT
jgi:putrescine transport system permease protein